MRSQNILQKRISQSIIQPSKTPSKTPSRVNTDLTAAPLDYYEQLQANNTPPTLVKRLEQGKSSTSSNSFLESHSAEAQERQKKRQQSIKDQFYSERLTQQIKKQKLDNDQLRNRQAQNFTASRRRNKTGLSLLTSMDNIL